MKSAASIPAATTTSACQLDSVVPAAPGPAAVFGAVAPRIC
jgi:hypothetical protein